MRFLPWTAANRRLLNFSNDEAVFIALVSVRPVHLRACPRATLARGTGSVCGVRSGLVHSGRIMVRAHRAESTENRLVPTPDQRLRPRVFRRRRKSPLA